MKRSTVITILLLTGCSKTAAPPSACRQLAELSATCTQFSRSVERLTEECEAMAELKESELDLTNASDVGLVSRIRRQRRGLACMPAKDCAALTACMDAAEAKEPPLPDAPPDQ